MDLSWIQVFILGCVEGITEFLPISSTAHLILASQLMHLEQTEFMKSFEIIIQLGAILSVVVLYWKQLLDMEIIKRLIIAFIPTGVLGLVFYKLIKQYLMGSSFVILSTLFLGGAFLVIFEWWYAEKGESINHIAHISYKKCFYIGLFQSIAMIPGVSRSAATIVGGLLLGLRRKTIVEFSFLLAMPTMAAATGLDLIKNAQSFTLSEAHFLIFGFAVSFIMAILGIKFFLSYIQKHSFATFGVYRMIVAIIFVILFFV